MTPPSPLRRRRPGARAALTASLLAATLVTACGPDVPVVPEGPRAVILISLDTLRPDRLGAYGNSDEVSPRIDELAGDAVLFDQALAPAPWTLPSHLSMLTGLDPVAHGVRNAGYKLSTHVTTLAEHLHDAGFATGAFTDGGFVAGKYGLDQGFDTYEDQRTKGGKDVNGFGRLMPDALEWIDDHGDEDFFLFLHTFDPHGPFDEGDEEVLARFRERRTPDGAMDHKLFTAQWLNQQRKMRVHEYERMSQLLNDYDAGVHVADRGVGQVVDALRALGRYETATIIVTSDHGEAMFEHDLHVGHGMLLFDSELRVPLVLKLPASEGAGTRQERLVDLLDIAPTVLDVLDLPVDPLMQGESLRRLVRREGRQRDSVLAVSSNSETYALVKDGHKFIAPIGIPPMEVARRHLGPMTPPMGAWARDTAYTQGQGDMKIELAYDMVADPLGLSDALATGEQLYDRALDPDEQVDVSAEKAEVTAELRARLLERWEASSLIHDQLADRGDLSAAPFNPHEQHALAMLGYLDTGSTKELRAIPKPMRESLLDTPHVAPDMGDLYRHDRNVHRVRLALAERGEAPQGTRRMLLDAGDGYVAWAGAHPEHQGRAVWRLVELLRVARETGVALEVDRWREVGIDLLQSQRDGR